MQVLSSLKSICSVSAYSKVYLDTFDKSGDKDMRRPYYIITFFLDRVTGTKKIMENP